MEMNPEPTQVTGGGRKEPCGLRADGIHPSGLGLHLPRAGCLHGVALSGTIAPELELPHANRGSADALLAA